jgi:glycosyltransferase involved in cell wall biosynthesis
MWSTGEPLRLITVSRLSESKNVQAIIQALPLIQHQLPGIHLDILGDGEYRAVLETLAADIGVSGAVTFHGNLGHEAVLKTLSRSHLFVFPTRVKEGFPKALLEAMACGLPVVATRVSVIPQLLANGCGMLLEDTTAPAVARAVLAITSDPGRMAYQGTLARQAAQGYTLEAWGETIGERLQAAWGPLKSEAK